MLCLAQEFWTDLAFVPQNCLEGANAKLFDGWSREWQRTIHQSVHRTILQSVHWNYSSVHLQDHSLDHSELMSHSQTVQLICHSFIPSVIHSPPPWFISYSIISYSFSFDIHNVDYPISSHLRFSDNFEAHSQVCPEFLGGLTAGAWQDQ